MAWALETVDLEGFLECFYLCEKAGNLGCCDYDWRGISEQQKSGKWESTRFVLEILEGTPNLGRHSTFVCVVVVSSKVGQVLPKSKRP